MAQWVPALVVGACGAALAAFLGVPVPFLIGPMAAGLVAAVLFGREYRLPQSFLSGAQVVIGLAVGLSFSLETVADLGRHLPAVLAVLAATTALSLANGWLLSRWTGIDRASGLLGSIPGAASAMVAAADKVGADARTVAVLQYVRLLFILAVAPAAASAWAKGHGAAAPAADGLAAGAIAAAAAAEGTLAAGAGLPGSPEQALMESALAGQALALVPALLLLVLLGVAGAAAATAVRLPSPYVLGPMIAATFLTAVGGDGARVPAPLFSAAVGVVGTSVGLRFDARVLRSLRRVVAIEVALLVGLLTGSALLAYALHRMTGIDLVTAVLGNVPGALEAIVAAAVDLQVDVPVVAAMQTVRSVGLLCLGPVIVRVLEVWAAPRAGAPGA